MGFSSSVVRYRFAGSPIIGNLKNGYTIGLSPEGEAICNGITDSSISLDEAALVNPELCEHLLRGGYLEQADVDVESVAEEASSPCVESAYLHVTQRCNLNCVGCYSLDLLRNHSKDPKLVDLFHAIFELAKAGIRTLVISGGEPFLYAHLADVVEFAKEQCGISDICIATNGLFLTEDSVAAIAPFADRVSVSFDGYSETSPAHVRGAQNFTALVKGVEILNKYSVFVQITPTLHAKNLDDMSGYAALVQELGAMLNYSLLSCSPDNDVAQELILKDEDLALLGRNIFEQSSGSGVSLVSNGSLSGKLTTKGSCGAGNKSLSVAADGTLYPCHMLHDSACSMGNLFTSNLSVLLDLPENRRLVNSLCACAEECTCCEFRWLCAGGCKARAHFSFGSLLEKDPYCLLYFSFYSALSKHIKTRL